MVEYRVEDFGKYCQLEGIVLVCKLQETKYPYIGYWPCNYKGQCDRCHIREEMEQ